MLKKQDSIANETSVDGSTSEIEEIIRQTLFNFVDKKKIDFNSQHFSGDKITECQAINLRFHIDLDSKQAYLTDPEYPVPLNKNHLCLHIGVRSAIYKLSLHGQVNILARECPPFMQIHQGLAQTLNLLYHANEKPDKLTKTLEDNLCYTLFILFAQALESKTPDLLQRETQKRSSFSSINAYINAHLNKAITASEAAKNLGFQFSI